MARLKKYPGVHVTNLDDQKEKDRRYNPDKQKKNPETVTRLLAALLKKHAWESFLRHS